MQILLDSGDSLMWQHPMFKSKEVVHMKPSSFCNMSWIFGIGNGCLLMCMLIALLSVNDLNEPSGFAIVKAGDAYSEVFFFLRTPAFTDLSTSSLSFCSCD